MLYISFLEMRVDLELIVWSLLMHCAFPIFVLVRVCVVVGFLASYKSAGIVTTDECNASFILCVASCLLSLSVLFSCRVFFFFCVRLRCTTVPVLPISPISPISPLFSCLPTIFASFLVSSSQTTGARRLSAAAPPALAAAAT